MDLWQEQMAAIAADPDLMRQMAQMMAASPFPAMMQGIMQGSQGMLQLGILPPPMVMQFTIELIKMMLHPIRHSRGVTDLIDGYQEMLGAYMKMDPTGALMRPPAPPPPPGGPGHAPPPSPSRGANGKGPPGPPTLGPPPPPGMQ